MQLLIDLQVLLLFALIRVYREMGAGTCSNTLLLSLAPLCTMERGPHSGPLLLLV